MNSTTVNTTERSSFTRIINTEYVKELVKEAKRVKYSVETFKDSDTGKGRVWGYEVRDTDHDNSLVFKVILLRANGWAGTFSKVYWQEPV